MIALAVMAAALALAFANGTNDNFKGVATLYGCGRLDFSTALGLANLATFAGSMAGLVVAKALLAEFGGQGLVPDAVSSRPLFALAVAVAAGLTVLAATRFGFPVSTTHALVGALVGAGLLASSQGIHWAALASNFVKPLLLTPLLAFFAGALLVPVFRRVETWAGLEGGACVCVRPPLEFRGQGAVAWGAATAVVTGTMDACAPARGAYLSARGVRDGLHLLSGAAVSFARGLNDTPKMAALLLLARGMDVRLSIPMVGGAILAGGWLGARRVGETMAHGITGMDENEAVGANLVTAGIVLGASALGSPASTTHVACGSLFGMGAVTGKARWGGVLGIAAAWLVTLPMGAALGMLAYPILAHGAGR